MASNLIWSASILEKSRISLSTVISVCADVRMMLSHWLCSVDRLVVFNRSIVPRTPVMGVRNSWLMTARNRDFARFAASASSRARVIA